MLLGKTNLLVYLHRILVKTGGDEKAEEFEAGIVASSS